MRGAIAAILASCITAGFFAGYAKALPTPGMPETPSFVTLDKKGGVPENPTDQPFGGYEMLCVVSNGDYCRFKSPDIVMSGVVCHCGQQSGKVK